MEENCSKYVILKNKKKLGKINDNFRYYIVRVKAFKGNVSIIYAETYSIYIDRVYIYVVYRIDIRQQRA